jgi:FSR family fosmidomycin resistance protein-like MFS transporter
MRRGAFIVTSTPTSAPAPRRTRPLDPHASGRQAPLLRTILYSTTLLDELTTGFFVVGLPLLRDRFHLSYAQAGLLFTVGSLSSLVLEPGINLLSDRGSKRVFVAAGMTTLAGAMVLMGIAPSFAVLLLAIAVLFPANGAAVGLAQAVLVDMRPEAAPRMLARWTLLSSVGDLLSPLAVTAFVAAGLGWTPLCLFAGALWLLAAVITWPQRFPSPARAAPEGGEEAEAEPHVGVLAAARDALRDPLLLRWTAVELLADALDEVFLGFAALYLRDRLHASVAATELALMAGLVGGLIGLVLLERALRRVAGPRLLSGILLVTVAGVAAFLLAPSTALAAAALFVTYLVSACWYPIAKAAAYATRPGQSGTVLSVGAIGAPFEIALPGVIGFLAGAFGLPVALGALGAAPLVALLFAPWRSGSHTRPGLESATNCHNGDSAAQ